MFSLDDKIAIVTGASRGIGRDISLGLARAGATVTLVSRTEAALQTVKSEIEQAGGNALVCPCDIADAEGVKAVAKQVTDTYGGLHILVNNAGMTRDNLIMRMSTDDWEAPIRTNLTGAFNFIKAVTRPMMKQRWGRIINITSVVGVTGNAGQANYAASKAGLIGLTKSTAKELASRGITVNAIGPGYVA
ncbi:MAG: SDR family NAD(P)-dependent oxidoreductase, partial [Candidatus Marinimicrobia bacterium]|nr:SDR family NAD(P)-dependent oxidoreductase [Candidatus Neomarinimicrobiota bacterium]